MASRIEIDVTELEAFYQRVRQAGDYDIGNTINRYLFKVGRLFVPATGTGPLANETPKRTWKLARSTVFQILGGPGRQVLEIRQAAKSELGVYYGIIVREGRGPVFAREGGFLHFFIGDQEFFRKSVGPADPNPYHRRVLARLMPEVQRIVNQMGEKLAAYISGQSA